jgi:hypothetical protein
MLFGMKVMGWHSQENYELTNERDFTRLSWRDRRIIQRAGWLAALANRVCMDFGRAFRVTASWLM